MNPLVYTLQRRIYATPLGGVSSHHHMEGGLAGEHGEDTLCASVLKPCCILLAISFHKIK